MRKRNPKWSVYVFSNKCGWGDEWSFKRFRKAIKFAKKQLKKGLSVTIGDYIGTMANKGD